MKAQIGIRLSAANAQIGILGRALAAATYGGSGFGGGGAGGAPAGWRPAGPLGARRRRGLARGRRGRPGRRLLAARRRLATLVPAAQPERGPPFTRAAQQMFGDLGHSPPR